MPDPSAVVELDAGLEGGGKIVPDVVSQDGGQNLPGERELGTDFFLGGKQKPGSGGGRDIGHPGHGFGGLADQGWVHQPGFMINGDFFQPGDFRRAQEISALARELPARFRLDFGFHHYRLLAGADGPVVEGFGNHDACHREGNVGGFLQVNRDIAASHPDGGGSGTVGGPDQPRPPGGQNQGKLFVPHQGMSQVARSLRQPLHAIFRGPRPQGGPVADLGGLAATAERAAMGADDDGIARFQGDQDLEHHGRSGVGDRDHGQDRAEGLGDLDDARGFVLGDHAHGFFVPDVAVNQQGGDQVFQGFVAPYPFAGFLAGQLGQGNPVCQTSQADLPDDPVGFFLAQLGEFGRRQGSPFKQIVGFGFHVGIQYPPPPARFMCSSPMRRIITG